jgi:hypothetical protein
MAKLRCLNCGSSRFDVQGLNCERCGKAHGLRNERCYITEETKETLLRNSSELAKFGIELEQRRPLGKSADTVLAALILIVHCADSLEHGALRHLVQYLKKLRIEKEEILRLRLDEPEKILAFYDPGKSERTPSKPAREESRSGRGSPRPTSGKSGQRKKNRQPTRRPSKRR